jgi:3-oxoacyl-[acyl-carrier protein] reductase
MAQRREVESTMLDGKVAVVVGGATGIGAATARLLAAEGASTIIAAPGPQPAMDEVCAAIVAAGGTATAVPCDVTDRAGVDAMFASVVERFGRVDIVVNSAGVFYPTPAFEPDAAHVDSLVRVNLLGGINVIHGGLKVMRQRGGAIVTVTSTQASLAEPGCAVYAATKAAMAHFTASLAPELKHTGIRVNCVAPGAVRTPMTAVLHASSDPGMRELLGRLNKHCGGPYGEFFLEPDHIASIVLFLVSDAARGLQATSVVADQGHTSALVGLEM